MRGAAFKRCFSECNELIHCPEFKFCVKLIVNCDCGCQPWFTRQSGSIDMAESEGVNVIKYVL